MNPGKCGVCESDYEPDYWEKLEHQYAGLALQARIIADQIRILQPATVGPGDSSTYAAEAAEDARALIAQLKGAALAKAGVRDGKHERVEE